VDWAVLVELREAWDVDVVEEVDEESGDDEESDDDFSTFVRC
jgi:hypothetical protein